MHLPLCYCAFTDVPHSATQVKIGQADGFTPRTMEVLQVSISASVHRLPWMTVLAELWTCGTLSAGRMSNNSGCKWFGIRELVSPTFLSCRRSMTLVQVAFRQAL